MNAFKKVIGYETIKSELMQICDMVHNKEKYDALGARMPRGILLHGTPGIGKTLLAKCFIEESELTSYTVRNNSGNDYFIDIITKAFKEAKENAPSIIFLDDMDKFANDDAYHRDAKEYVAVQAGIDDVKDSDVFVIATTNDIEKLPRSLVRSGRFDKIVLMQPPTKEDAAKIIEHYIDNKKVSDNVNFDDLCKMMSYHSCADLETLLNEAAITAGYNNQDSIEMKDLVGAVLRLQYNSPDDLMEVSDEKIRKVALHEAGHVVACEVLKQGSVGLASIRTRGRGFTNGFIHKCEELERRPHYIMVSLAGKVAVELYYSESVATGCYSDLRRAYDSIREGMSKSATVGIGMLDVSTRQFPDSSDGFVERNEAVVQAELERHIIEARNILLQNRDFLERIADALVEKETLLFSDIQAIRDSVKIVKTVA